MFYNFLIFQSFNSIQSVLEKYTGNWGETLVDFFHTSYETCIISTPRFLHILVPWLGFLPLKIKFIKLHMGKTLSKNPQI